eukprot:2912585-Rhodomonas_salina.1
METAATEPKVGILLTQWPLDRWTARQCEPFNLKLNDTARSKKDRFDSDSEANHHDALYRLVLSCLSPRAPSPTVGRRLGGAPFYNPPAAHACLYYSKALLESSLKVTGCIDLLAARNSGYCQPSVGRALPADIRSDTLTSPMPVHTFKFTTGRPSDRSSTSSSSTMMTQGRSDLQPVTVWKPAHKFQKE